MNAAEEAPRDLDKHVNDLVIQFDDLRAIFWSLQGNAMHKDLGWDETNEQLIDLGMRLAGTYGEGASKVEGLAWRAKNEKPTTFAFDGTGAPSNPDAAPSKFIDFAACIAQAERVYDAEAAAGVEFGAWVENHGNGVTLAEAQVICRALRTGGFRDWRLPTTAEFLAIPNDGWPKDVFWTSTPGDSPAETTTITLLEGGEYGEWSTDATSRAYFVPVRTSLPDKPSRRAARGKVTP